MLHPGTVTFSPLVSANSVVQTVKIFSGHEECQSTKITKDTKENAFRAKSGCRLPAEHARFAPSGTIAGNVGISDYRLQITDSEFAIPIL
jgi:hypothetical protein